MKPALIVVAGIVALAVVLALVIGVEVWLAGRNRPPGYGNPQQGVKVFGIADSHLRLVVMGDSTAAGQGAPYDDGIAVGSAKHLAKKYRVEMTNLAVSGSKAAEAVTKQLPAAAALKPDIVLISVGANDVVARTNPAAVTDSLQKLTDGLVAANCKVKIILTGSPDMGAIPRFAQPLRTLAGWQTNSLNVGLYPWIIEHTYSLAPIALETGPVFRKDPTLFASDRFHPNARGYAVWLKTIRAVLDDALVNEPSHCAK